MMLRRVTIFLSLVLVLSVTNISLMNAQLLPSESSETYLLIVNNDGSITKFNPVSRSVLWHSSLQTNFISFNHTNLQSFEQLSYVLPNFDGNFIYVSQKNNPINIERRQLQRLLNRCLDKNMKYFLYDSVDYYVLNTQTGSIEQLKRFLDEKNSLTKQNYVLRIDKKHLKSLTEILHENWSTISSQITILTTKEFTKNSKMENQVIKNKDYEFYRKSPKSIEIVDLLKGEQYQLYSDASFITVFSLQNDKIAKHNIEIDTKYSSAMKQLEGKSFSTDDMILTFDTVEYQKILSTQKSDSEEVGQMQFCINSIRVLENQSKHFKAPQLTYTYTSRVVDTQASFLSQLAIGGIVLFVVGICLGCLISKVKKEMQLQMSNNKSSIEKRIQQMEKQLQETKNIPKSLPYTIKYDDLKRTHNDVKVYVSTILSKETEVAIFPLSKHEYIIDKVETVSSVNNKRLIKVWHHQVNEEEYLIFTDKITHTLDQYLEVNKGFDQKMIIREIIQMIRSLQANSIKIHCLSPSHIVVSDDGQFKFNSLVPDNPIWSSPTILEGKEPSEQSTLFMLANIMYFINSKGKYLFQLKDNSNEQIVDSFKKLNYIKQAQCLLQQEHIFNGILNNLFNSAESKFNLENIDNHVFFWNDVKNLAFINEFSNYMETHLDDDKVKKFQTAAKEINAVPLPWSAQLPKEVLVDIISFRKYDFSSVRDIIRVIRNKSNHFHQVPENVRKITGKTKQDLCRYYLTKFSRLLYFMYRYTQKKKWKLHGF